MRKPLVLAIVVLFAAIMVPAVVGAEGSLAFTWGFFLKDGPGQIRSLTFDSPEEVAGGDLLRIYLELRDSSYVYLYLFDSMDDLYMVFPPDPGFYNGEFPAWHKTYIPAGRNWFTLDDTKGIERFFLLASQTRLEDLEKMTVRFMSDRDASHLQDDLLKVIMEKVGLFSAGSSFGSVPVKVRHGQYTGISREVSLLDARTISTSGNYGVVLELVNR